MALGAPEDTGAELALVAAGVPPPPVTATDGDGAAAGTAAERRQALTAAFSAVELRVLLEAERATALLAMHHAEAAACAVADGATTP